MVDGDNGMGHLVMARAAETAIALAQETGVAWVGARRSNHAGAAGVYAAMTLPHDMVGIYAVVANANHMPVWGAAENLLGTNPLAFAIPAGEEPPVVLDIATTVVSYGTVKAHKLQGKPMPEGWMVDPRTASRSPTRRKQRRGPAAADRRLQGLGPCAGARPARRHAQRRGVRPRRGRLQRRRRERLQHRPFHHRARRRRASCRSRRSRPRSTATLRDLKASQLLPGFDAIRLPGEQRLQRRADRRDERRAGVIRR